MTTPENPEPWTTERIREAFIFDGGHAEYYDPINGAAENRRVAGSIFDAWLVAHDAALLVSPTDGEVDAAIDLHSRMAPLGPRSSMLRALEAFLAARAAS